MEAHRITVDEVKKRHAAGEDILFLDTRNPTAWAEADEMIPGAVRMPADRVADHLDALPHDRTIVAYCT